MVGRPPDLAVSNGKVPNSSKSLRFFLTSSMTTLCALPMLSAMTSDETTGDPLCSVTMDSIFDSCAGLKRHKKGADREMFKR